MLKQKKPILSLWLYGCVFVIVTCLLASCAGPISPFGAINHIPAINQQAKISQERFKDADPNKSLIELSPDHQILHAPFDFTVIINDPDKSPTVDKIAVKYNGYDVTKQFLSRAIISADRSKLSFVVRNLTLLRHEIASIDIIYSRMANNLIIKSFLRPDCPVITKWQIKTDSKRQQLIDHINRVTQANKLNPALLWGIAATNGFDSTAINSSAVGLMLVPNFNAKDWDAFRQNWSYPEKLASYPAILLPLFKFLNIFSSQDDWRLDQTLSIEASATILNKLYEHWANRKYYRLLEENLPQPQESLIYVVLASYLINVTTVERAIRLHKERFLTVAEIQQKIAIMNQIISFCYHGAAASSETAL